MTPFRCLALAAAFGLATMAGAAFAENRIGGDAKLNVAVYLVEPYGKAEPGGLVSGLSVELWQIVASNLGQSYSLTGETSIDAVFKGLNEGRYDLAIGPITITPAREAEVDFSHATHPSGVSYATQRPSGTQAALRAVSETLQSLAPLILTIAGLIALTGFVLSRLEGKRGDATHPGTIATIGDGIYWAAVTMTTVGYGDKVPRTKLGRSLTILWMFVSIIVISVFSGTVTAKLAVSELTSSPAQASSFQGKRLAAPERSSAAEYLGTQGLNFVAYPDLRLALAALDRGEADVVFNSQGALVHEVDAHYPGSLVVRDHPLTKANMAFALPEGTGEVEVLNRAILLGLASPEWENERKRVAGEHGLPDEQCVY